MDGVLLQPHPPHVALESPKSSLDEKAQRVSDAIDEEIKREAARRKEARRKQVKVILLGQAESGKSTLRKQFQLYYASQTLDYERPSWRLVVYFNVVRAVRMILDELEYDFSPSIQYPPLFQSVPEDVSPRTTSLLSELETKRGLWEEEIQQLRARLLPLTALEKTLAAELSGGVSVSGGGSGAFVRAGWQALVATFPNLTEMPRQSKNPAELVTLTAKTLNSSMDAIKTLWRHRAVRRLIDLRKLRLNESAPFFLDSIDRIAEPGFLPTNSDILNVRLQTLGVMEHTFTINIGALSYDWKLYDVGGARGQRPAWIPYFDDATAIIFLAPISAFDQYLEEDPKTNRIDDSLQLFTAVCSNKLLKDAQIVLMLNKADLLKKKLKAGTKVKRYITSYHERPNTFEVASEYFRNHFIAAHRRKDASPGRMLFVHFTSMLDIKATHRIIANVGDVILTKHIEHVGIL